MCLQFAFPRITRVTMWLRRPSVTSIEKTAEILILPAPARLLQTAACAAAHFDLCGSALLAALLCSVIAPTRAARAAAS